MQLTVNQVAVLQVGIPELLDCMSPEEVVATLENSLRWADIRKKIAKGAVTEAIQDGTVVAIEKYDDAIASMQADIDDLTINEGEFERDAHRLQELIAERRTADALELLAEMAPGVGLSVKAAQMVAGFRQPSLFPAEAPR